VRQAAEAGRQGPARDLRPGRRGRGATAAGSSQQAGRTGN